MRVGETPLRAAALGSAMPDSQITAFAFWKRLDVPGHDAARLRMEEEGPVLEGTAVFGPASEAICAHYTVALHADYRTRSARVEGWRAGESFVHVFERTERGWSLDGVLHEHLHDLVDLDFGFTPATNYAQLRRLNVQPGALQTFEVAWFDLSAPTELRRLPQTYRRRDQHSYEYEAPEYTAVLAMLPNGFVRSYPGLWQAEP